MTSGDSWTLEAELCRLAGMEDLPTALHQLELLPEPASNFRLTTAEDWHRSGAETYSLVFTVQSSGWERKYFMKACVGYSAGTPLSSLFAEWLSRRAVVARAGIETPRLYAAGAALLVEEFIPYTLTEALEAAPSAGVRLALVDGIGKTAGELVRHGFVPLSAHDWRSRGRDVVVVDFGQDLGSPTAAGSELGLLSEILDNIARAGAALTANDLQVIGRSYGDALGG